MSKDKTEQYLKEIAHFSRKTSDNAQFFFWLFVIGGGLAIIHTVFNQVR
jgi:hypothetical protein